MNTPENNKSEDIVCDGCEEEAHTAQKNVMHKHTCSPHHEGGWQETLKAIGYANLNEGVIESLLSNQKEQMKRVVEGMVPVCTHEGSDLVRKDVLLALIEKV